MIYFLKFETFSVSLDSMSVALRCALFFNMERIFTVSLCQIEQYAYSVCMQKAFRLQINNRKVLKNNLLTGSSIAEKNDDNLMKQLNTDHEEG